MLRVFVISYYRQEMGARATKRVRCGPGARAFVHDFRKAMFALRLGTTEPIKSPVVKRSVVVNGHKSSVSLGEGLWSSIKEIAAERGIRLSDLVSEIDQDRQHGNLSSALRLYVLEFYQKRSAT